MDNIKRIDFKGIVRTTSPQNNADGNCEEIINLRQDSGVWCAVGRKRAIIENVDYEQVYIHKYGTFENYIGVKDGKAIWFASLENGRIVSKNQEICNISGEASLNQLNNILLVKDDNNIAKAVFRENKYSVASIELPDVPVMDVKSAWGSRAFTGEYQHFQFTTGNELEEQAVRDGIFGLYRKEREAHENYTEGRVFLIAVYELFDGSLSKPTPPMLVELGEFRDDIIRGTNMDNWALRPGGISKGDVRVDGLILSQLNVKVNNILDDRFKDVIKNIHIYVSPVTSFYDSDDIAFGAVERTVNGKVQCVIHEKEFKPEDLKKLLFFRALTVKIGDTTHDYTVIPLNEDLTSNKTLAVDGSSWINTTGEMFVYNTRLHLYNLKRSFDNDPNLPFYLEGVYKMEVPGTVPPGNPDHITRPGMVLKYSSDLTNSRMLTAVTYLKLESEDLKVVNQFRVELVSSTSNSYTVKLPKFISFPDSRAYKMELYDGRYSVRTLEITPSDAYNFAFIKFTERYMSGRFGYEIGTDDNIVTYTFVEVNIPGLDSNLDFIENNHIIASESFNPYYFPPEHSYAMPGEILNLAVNTEQISSSQVGMFPLYVFTTEGIYGLQVGDGKVLYSNVIPISAEVAVKGSSVLQTRYGIAFVTESGLKLISGQEVVDLSKPLNGSPDMNVRRCEAFRLLAQHPQLYDCSPFFSTRPFREYVREAVMGYDISKDEIIVSNPAYVYSYVYSLETKTWHKITEVFSGFNRHLALKPVGEGSTVCDIRTEESEILPVYLQTRPLSMETFGFKKIAHALLRGELYPVLDKYYSTMIFASNDLLRWVSVADAQIQVNAPHALIERVGHSFRYFAFATGGEVESDHVIALAEIEGADKWDNRLR